MLSRVYLGLTDDPDQEKPRHGNPPDWAVHGPFATEQEARAWLQLERARLGDLAIVDSSNTGWRRGYSYGIRSPARE